jgi:hypothetical protein
MLLGSLLLVYVLVWLMDGGLLLLLGSLLLV